MSEKQKNVDIVYFCAFIFFPPPNKPKYGIPVGHGVSENGIHFIKIIRNVYTMEEHVFNIPFATSCLGFSSAPEPSEKFSHLMLEC